MTTYSTHAIIDALTKGFDEVTDGFTAISNLPDAARFQHPISGGWNAAEVVAHLNFYSQAYNKRFAEAIRIHAGSGKDYFSTGWLGDYFVGLMTPKPDGFISKKMKAPAASHPKNQINFAEIFPAFFSLQSETSELLEQSLKVNLRGVRIKTMLPLVSLRMGDAFRFLLAHQQRHLMQAQRAAGIIPSQP